MRGFLCLVYVVSSWNRLLLLDNVCLSVCVVGCLMCVACFLLFAGLSPSFVVCYVVCVVVWRLSFVVRRVLCVNCSWSCAVRWQLSLLRRRLSFVACCVMLVLSCRCVMFVVCCLLCVGSWLLLTVVCCVFRVCSCVVCVN